MSVTASLNASTTTTAVETISKIELNITIIVSDHVDSLTVVLYSCY